MARETNKVAVEGKNNVSDGLNLFFAVAGGGPDLWWIEVHYAVALVSSYPYPPEFISWMRDVFKSPQPFIDACLEAARKEQLTG